jgi:hypothetical protein
MSPMQRLPFILRDHRDQLRQRWIAALEEVGAGEDYRELMASAVGDRFLRKFVDDLIALSEAEAYELPALRSRLHEDAAREAEYRLGLGFVRLDLVKGWQTLSAAVVDVLEAALVMGELPPPGEVLLELKAFGTLLDHMVRASMGVAPAESGTAL